MAGQRTVIFGYFIKGEERDDPRSLYFDLSYTSSVEIRESTQPPEQAYYIKQTCVDTDLGRYKVVVKGNPVLEYSSSLVDGEVHARWLGGAIAGAYRGTLFGPIMAPIRIQPTRDETMCYPCTNKDCVWGPIGFAGGQEAKISRTSPC